MNSNLLLLLLALIIICASCGEAEYPITFTYESVDESYSTVITTTDEDEVIEIDGFTFIETTTGSSQFELFEESYSNQIPETITIESESEITIDFGMNNPNGMPLALPIVDNKVEALGYKIEDNKITQDVCFGLGRFLSGFIDSQVNRCTSDDNLQNAIDLFNKQDMTVGDTLAFSILEYTYTAQ